MTTLPVSYLTLAATALTPPAPPMPASLVETVSQKVNRVIYMILSIIIVPIGIIRLIGYMIHQIGLKQIIQTAQYTTCEIENANKWARMGKNSEEISLLNPQGEQLHGFFMKGEKHPEKVMLIFSGNAVLASSAASNSMSLGHKLGVSCCSVDYPGIGESHGSLSLENLPLTVYSTLHYLVHERNIDPKNIVVHGFSLGGVAISKGIALFEEENPKAAISVVSSHTCSHLTGAVDGVVSLFAGRFVGGLARFFAWSSGLDFECKESFDRLRGRKLVIYNENDPIIPYRASLAKAIQTDPCYEKVETEEESSLTLLRDSTPNWGHDPHLNGHEGALLTQKVSSMFDLEFIPPKDYEPSPLSYYKFTQM